MRFTLVLFAIVIFGNSCTSSEHSLNTGCLVAQCINGDNGDLSELLSAILCNNCLTKILSNRDIALRFNDIQQQLKSDEMNNYGHKRLDDLNADVMLLIFDELDFIDILSLIKAHSTLLGIAKNTFWRKYRNYAVTIDAHENSVEFRAIRTIEIEWKSIHAYQFKLGKKLLKQFGDVIERIKIMSSSNSFPAQYRMYSMFSQWIHKYASNLKALDLNRINSGTFIHFDRPIEQVQELSFISYGWNNNENIKAALPLNQLFPNLRVLLMELHFNLNYSFTLCEYSQLDHLKVHLKHVWKEEEFIDTLLSKNRQIKRLDISTWSQNIYNTINKYLQNLEHLTVTKLNEAVNATFEQVKHFECHNVDDEAIAGLSMRNLESLRINYHTRINIYLIPFLKRHQSVRHLMVREMCRGESHRFVQLIGAFSNLVEISIETMADISVLSYVDVCEFIDQIIERHETIEKLNILFYPEKNAFNLLHQRYAQNWEFAVDHSQHDCENGVYLSLERKR